MKEAEEALNKLNTELQEKQIRGALVKEEVDSEDIAEVVARWT